MSQNLDKGKILNSRKKGETVHQEKSTLRKIQSNSFICLAVTIQYAKIKLWIKFEKFCHAKTATIIGYVLPALAGVIKLI